jgi:hypothetical protein
MVLPHAYPDKFRFHVINNSVLRIARSINEAWWFDLKIRLVNTRISKEKELHIGKHGESILDIQFEEGFFAPDTLPSNVFFANTVKPDDIHVNDIVVVMPGVIRVTSNPMLDVHSRSCFTTAERLSQTLAQIDTVRKNIPHATIIMQEASLLTRDEIALFASVCDYTILYNDENAYEYCHHNFENKGLAEIHVLIHIAGVLAQKQFKYFIKFGCRYHMTPKFDINRFLKDVPVVRCEKGDAVLQTSRGIVHALVYCLFYCLPRKYLDMYRHHFSLWLTPETREPIEHIFSMMLQSLPRVEVVDLLHIEGFTGAKGEYVLL